MKPDGVTMDTSDTTEPTEAAAAAESSVSQDNATEQTASLSEQAPRDVSPEDDSKDNGEPDAQVKLQAVASNKQAATKTQASLSSKSQPHTSASHCPVNSMSSGNKSPEKSTVAGPAPKRQASVATVVPTVKTTTKAVHKRPAASGPSQSTSTATAATRNGTRPKTASGSQNKRTAANNVEATSLKISVAVSRPANNVAAASVKISVAVSRPANNVDAATGRVKTSAVSRPAASTAPKPYMNVAAKVDSGAIPKTSRPATVPLTAQGASTSRAGGNVANRAPTSTAAASGSQPVPSTSRAGNNVASRPPSSTSSRTAASRGTTLPSTGRTTTQHHPAAAAVKKDVRSPAAKKPAPLKPKVTGKPPSASKWAAMPKKQDSKGPQHKNQPAKPSGAKSSCAVSPKPPTASKQPLGKTLPASPATKSANGSVTLTKPNRKPTQAVLPFTAGVKKTKHSKCNPSPSTGRNAGAVDERLEPMQTVAQEQSTASAAPEVAPAQASTQDFPPEAASQVTTSSLPRSPVTTTLPEMPPPRPQSDNDAPSAQQDHVTTPVTLPAPKVASQPINLSSDQTPYISTAVKLAAQVAPPGNLNYEEDEEGSQLVSVSEMSGTTQPTEESRPGSAGLVGGSTWRAGSAFLSELDSLSGSQQGASELSAPGVLEGTESMDDLGEGSLKGAMDMEGASAGSPDFQKVPDIPFNDYEEDDDDDEDRVCDMDVGSEKTDELQRHRHDDDEDEDVEMASEAVTESGLESYGNADEDDFAEDERLDNLNRLAQLPPPPRLPSAPGALWYQPNPFADSWQEHVHLPEPVSQPVLGEAAVSPLVDPLQADSDTPSQSPAQASCGVSADPQNQEVPLSSALEDGAKMCIAVPLQTPDPTSLPLSSESGTPEELGDGNPQIHQVLVTSPQPHMTSGDQEVRALTMQADEVLRGVVNALTSNPSSSSATEEEASDTEGEALLDDALETPAVPKGSTTLEVQSPAQRILSTVEEVEESETTGLTDNVDVTPPSASSLASYGFNSATTASNAQSMGEGAVKSPGIFSLEELPEESKELGDDKAQSGFATQQYECGELEVKGSDAEAVNIEDKPDDDQPPYYTTCETTDNSFAGITLQPHLHHRRHGDPHGTAPRLTCADLPPRKAGQQALSPQLRRLEQHQRQLMEMQQRREQQSRPLEGAEQERKRTEEEEQKKKKDEAEEEIKRNEREVWEQAEVGKMADESGKRVDKMAESDKMADEYGKMAAAVDKMAGEPGKMVAAADKMAGEPGKMAAAVDKMAGEDGQMVEKVKLVNGEVKMSSEEEAERRELELQLLQQQSELKQRQQILQWQQELEEQPPSPGRTVVLSPSSGLCTIYEALENSDEEPDGLGRPDRDTCERRLSPDLNGDHSSPEHPLDLDWGAKVDMVQQLINQTLLLNGDGCSSLLLLPGGAGGTLSPLESSLWPSLLPPISPPSATVTSVSSFSPEAVGSSPQGEWTVVELETHH
ncbi:uncharacterized protein prr36a isoform X2 [Festucalex cinctus]